MSSSSNANSNSNESFRKDSPGSFSSSSNNNDNVGGANLMSMLQQLDSNRQQACAEPPLGFGGASCGSLSDLGGSFHPLPSRTSSNYNKRSLADLFESQQSRNHMSASGNNNFGSFDQHQHNGGSSSDGAPNAITAFLQAQMKNIGEAKECKRQKRVVSDLYVGSGNTDGRESENQQQYQQDQSHHRKVSLASSNSNHSQQQQQQQQPMMRAPQLPSGYQQQQAQARAPAPLPPQQQRLMAAPQDPLFELEAAAGPPPPQQQDPVYAMAPAAPQPPQMAANSASSSSSGSNGATATGATTNRVSSRFYLHNACRHFATQRDVVEIAVSMDPEAVRRQADASFKEASAQPSMGSSTKNLALRQHRILQERYSYPINIALQNKASMDVLEVLVQQGPDVLTLKDGYERACSLSIALCHKPRDLDLIDLLLFANVNGIMVTDRKLNYPLHIAAAKGASVDVLKRLYAHYPAALFQQNFNSETPFDIARRSIMIDEKALNFLHDQFQQGCLKVARHSFTRVRAPHHRAAAAAAPPLTMMKMATTTDQLSMTMNRRRSSAS